MRLVGREQGWHFAIGGQQPVQPFWHRRVQNQAPTTRYHLPRGYNLCDRQNPANQRNLIAVDKMSVVDTRMLFSYSSANQGPSRHLQRLMPPKALVPNICFGIRQLPWYNQSPMLNTVYMDPNYHQYHIKDLTGAAPRFCAAELNVDKNKQSFSLLPIPLLPEPMKELIVTLGQCKIEYWESYLYNTKRVGMSWEDLHEGMPTCHKPSRTNPLTSAPSPICPAPYSIASQGDTFYYRRHSSLKQHPPGDFHGYGNFDRSFKDGMRSFLDAPFAIPTRRSINGTGLKFAFCVVLLSIILIAAYLRKHIGSWSDDLDHPWLYWIEHKSA
jgi:hypothetical protein